MARFSFKDKVAVVTGAGSGIGEALAHALAARGCHVALADIKEDELNRVRDALASNHIRVSVHPGDVSDPDYPDQLLEAVKAIHGRADVLVNNAGIAHGGTFEELDEDRFDRVMDVNLNAPIRMTRRFLQEFRAQGSGYIANVASIFGIIAPAKQSAYCATKFGLRGFTEALNHELAEDDNIHVSVIMPGGVRTNIVKNVIADEEVSEADQAEMNDGFERLLTFPPEKAAEAILKGMEAKRNRITFGNGSGLVKLIVRLFPDSYAKKLSFLIPKTEQLQN